MKLKIQKFLLVSFGMIFTLIFIIATLKFSVQSYMSKHYIALLFTVLLGLVNMYGFLESVNLLLSKEN